MEEATGILEVVADESWVLWVERLIPNEESGRMEPSAMEVDEGGESEVVAVEEGQQGGGQKCVPSLSPKAPRKRVHAMTATQSQVGSQLKTRSMGSMGTPCKWCVQQGIIGGSDKTMVSVATGHQEYHPVYQSPGNFINTACQAHSMCVMPIMFLPISKGTTIPHTCLAQLLSSETKAPQ